jgi:hypothetical protein
MIDARMPNGPSTPLPGWLGSVVQITTQVGVPTVFAGILLWFVLFRMDAALRVIEQSEDARTKIIAALQESITTHMDQQGEIFEQVMQANIRANKENADRLERLLSSFTMKAKSHGGGTEPPP